jgi:hypothetical protein
MLAFEQPVVYRHSEKTANGGFFFAGTWPNGRQSGKDNTHLRQPESMINQGCDKYEMEDQSAQEQ